MPRGRKRTPIPIGYAPNEGAYHPETEQELIEYGILQMAERMKENERQPCSRGMVSFHNKMWR